ncbi:uncharacterized protein LOC129976482 [Argiope bruennichi]|uniref:uncharacterized protein LOC129976482 n=1 Tax=Argiope bruennichi TaxID=94029 RepID=UPI0024944926|nr:uncharacterized protein LOC129976482 [Argiope bruennichi]
MNFPLPAATVCYENMSLKMFCHEYPHLCQKPKIGGGLDLCIFHPHYCSVKVMPKLGHFTNYSKEIDESSFKLLPNDSYRLPFLAYPNPRKLTTVFTQVDQNRYVQCHSENLHLYDKNDLRFVDNKGREEDQSLYVIFSFKLKIPARDLLFDPWDKPKVFFALHSPFEPINPVYDGETFYMESDYVVEIERLEEDRLLPYPYQTNCMDYEALWESNNRTGPRSQEICLELCRGNYVTECKGCVAGMTMFDSLQNLCSNSTDYKCSNEDLDKGFIDKIQSCLVKCKPDCLKLKYYYKVATFPAAGEYSSKEGPMDIKVIIRNPDNILVAHVPMYGDEELFSYIGGLTGCWLGISVWSFTGIVGNACIKVLRLKQRRNERKK